MQIQQDSSAESCASGRRRAAGVVKAPPAPPASVWVTEYAAPPVSQTLRKALSTAPASKRCTSENRVAATYAVAPTAVPRAAR